MIPFAIKKPALKALKFAVGKAAIYVMPLMTPNQEVINAPGARKQIAGILKEHGAKKSLIVTDKIILKFGLIDAMINEFNAKGIQYVIYDGVEPNPSISNIEEAYRLYKESGCDSLIGFGGGSSMDCAKATAARVIKPKKTAKQLGGYFKIMLPIPKRIPFTINVPTTSGTGAEKTCAAVISDPDADRKYTINDFMMTAHYAILDPELTLGLPAYPTACTAIDAVSHCVEGYVGGGHSKKTDKMSVDGIRYVFENIQKVVDNGKDIEARGKIHLAAYYGGCVLNGALTGYVHPFCHKIGAKYHLVHGRCIGAVLPIILEDYGDTITDRLATLVDEMGIWNTAGMNKDAKAKLFIAKIREFNEVYGIQANIPELNPNDYEEIYKSIDAENILYPTPVIYSRDDIFRLLDKIKG